MNAVGKKIQTLKEIYPMNREQQEKRYHKLAKLLITKYQIAEKPIRFFSCPGRLELVGNHTDHNNGKVMAMSTDIDTIAAVVANNQKIIQLYSLEYQEEMQISLTDLHVNQEDSSSTRLLKQMLQSCQEQGYFVGGFSAVVTSEVMNAAGVSSSASFEMLILLIVNTLFNAGSIDFIALAKIAQTSENRAWHKTSGLLDQIASAFGGTITIDFANQKLPIIDSVENKRLKEEICYLVVPTGEDHAELSAYYASITEEMALVCQHLKVNSLRETDMEQLLNNFKSIPNDRAVLRACHYFYENERVTETLAAFHQGDTTKFFSLIRESGESSWQLLQNNYVPGSSTQKVPLALTIVKDFVRKENISAGYRVHGGGFAGTILVAVEKQNADKMAMYLTEKLFAPVEIKNRAIGFTEVKI